MPAAIVALPGLTNHMARALLARLGVTAGDSPVTRRLRGCVLAQRGRALILLDAGDPEEERMMTLAHEASHLLVHYLEPRRRAIEALGPSVLAVLDGDRQPTTAEALTAVLRGVTLTRFRHSLEHLPRRGQIERLEDEADHLAIELIAPQAVLRRLGDRSPGALRAQFGFPASIAANLSASLAPAGRGQRGVLHLLKPGRVRN
ncbi:MAG: hypothetical protein ACK4SZ_16645 [Allosphingosinicella sp.]|uniref:hypothetical protein n=1 Tax=Allosphingosinicella sp. TaxID=2823234 RepID=UPI00393475A5